MPARTPRRRHAAADRGTPPRHVVFIGMGAVGSGMLICLSELADRDSVPVRFTVFTPHPDRARDALFNAEPLFDRIEFVEVPDFEPLFKMVPPYDRLLRGTAVIINAALPAFNGPMIELALRLGAHTVDLASDMYNEETERTLAFPQYRHDAALRARGCAAFINFGVAPGMTDFLIGERMHELLAGNRQDLEVESIDLFLLEDIDSDSVIFSWSPVVALEELAQRPRVIRDGVLVALEPFSSSREYLFPHEPEPTRQYPLYQEELLSLHRAFPQVESISVYTGGSEVELVKALFQLNLLSKRTLPDRPDLTVEALVRSLLPGMKNPRRIEAYLRDGTIRSAHFAAAAEIRVSERIRTERRTVIETIGLSYQRYRGLIGSPYAGATYISYPTAVCAAILLWHTLEHMRAGRGAKLVGVLTGEDLAKLLPRSRAHAIRRDLVAWDIDLFGGVRDASES